MNDLKKILLFEKLHQNDLNDEDKAALEELLNSEEAAKRELDDFNEIFDGFEALHIDEVQQNFASFEKKYSVKDTKDSEVKEAKVIKLRSFKKHYLAAASLALLLCCTLAYQQFTSSPYDNYFAANESISINLNSSRGEGIVSDEEKIKSTAYTRYHQQDYNECVILLEDYKKAAPKLYENDQQSQLVLGVSYLILNQDKKALSYLEMAHNNKGAHDHKDVNFDQYTDWYLALAYIKNRDNEKAKKILNSITGNNNHMYKEDAESILKEL